MTDAYLIPVSIAVALSAGYGTLKELQLNNYRPVWAADKMLVRYAVAALAAAVCAAAAVVWSDKAAFIIFTALSAVAFILINTANLGMRTGYKFTKRATRLALAYAALTAALVAAAALAFSSVAAGVAAVILCCGLSPTIAKFAALIMLPFEKANNRRYTEKAKAYLAGLNVVSVGITGSYGKTSCKNILAEMLSTRYKVIKTEGNYNTPLGIAKTLGNYAGEQIFIAEMGARRRGDIRELCDMVRPKYAIITGVAPQHLESFGDIDNVARTKFELAEAIPEDGLTVFNGDNPYTRRMRENSPSPSVSAGYKEGEYRAENVRLNSQGCKFVLVTKADRIPMETTLLGRHNVLNIVLCAALAHEMGVSLPEIARTVKELRPVPHRLEASRAGDITVIDDSYNANIEGVGCALEVLAAFPGRKVVYTQGIVELGRAQKSVNREVGRLVAAVADAVILSGVNAQAIYEGLRESGFSGEVHRYSGLKEAEEGFKEVLRPGDVLLIQNDIP